MKSIDFAPGKRVTQDGKTTYTITAERELELQGTAFDLQNDNDPDDVKVNVKLWNGKWWVFS